MGKTSTPMKILLTDSTLLQHPDFKPVIDEMVTQGHQITADDSLGQYQFIAGPNCWYCVPEVAALFNMAVTQGRKVMALEKKALPKKEKAAKVPKAKKPKKTKLPTPEPAGDIL